MYNIKMPKNVKGGSSHRSSASKDCQIKYNSKTRLAIDEYELYAQVKSLCGNGMCIVFCQDSKFRLCIIRGKFKGKGKRDNILVDGTWVLVGLREFESEHDVGKIDPSNIAGKKEKLDKCDLLEVYKDRDKDYLKNEVKLPCWSQFTFDKVVSKLGDVSGYENNEIIFSNDTDNDYKQLMEMDLTGEAPKKMSLIKKEAEEAAAEEANKEDFNIDDI